jgi:Domain of Unknown Function (DUF1259)
MLKRQFPRAWLFAGFLTVALNASAATSSPAFDTVALDQAVGTKGDYISDEGVYKFSKSRKDLSIKVGDWSLPGFLGVGSWAAFTVMQGGQAMLMGDNALLEDEVGPAMRAALDNGLSVTGLHNHFAFDQPKVYFMHVEGMGAPAQLAAAVRKVFDAPDQVRVKSAVPASGFGGAPAARENHITGESLAQILGTKGQAMDGMYKVTIGRKASARGMSVGKEMGVNTWAGFAGTDEAAVVDGDFAMHEDELQPVLKTLLASGINVVAIHQHMTGEQPRIMFLHYWGQGRAADLARGVKSALDRTATAAEQK